MKILFLAHNTPYPPNKGDKIRAFHVLNHLSKYHEVHLYSLVRDRKDLRHEKDLQEICHNVKLFPLNNLFSKIKSLLAILSPFPLTFGYYFSFWLRRDLRKALAREKFDLVYAYCSSMGQYLYYINHENTIVDFVDVDSIKWKEYAAYKSFPMSFIYSLEYARLQRWEGKLCEKAKRSLVTTNAEKEKLAKINFSAAKKISVVRNGIDFDTFKLEESSPEKPQVVFVGQMDYLPNIDAVIYFYLHIFPIIKKEVPDFVFEVVGRNPAPELREICVDAEITGEVEDVRIHLRDARVFVAPFRLAFGTQNKVLEAMATGIPVVATSKVLQGLRAQANKHLLVADNPVDFAQSIIALLKDKELHTEIRQNARSYVEREHVWQSILEDFEGGLKELST